MHGKQRTVAWLLGLILTVPGSAWTSAQRVETSGSGPASKDACFDSRKVRSFSPLHEKFVYVQVGSDEHYLLTLDRLYADAEQPLLGRPSANVITFTGADSFGRVCSNMAAATAAFTVSGSPEYSRLLRVPSISSNMAATAAFTDSGSPVFRRIVRVEAVPSKEAAQELVEARTTPK